MKGVVPASGGGEDSPRPHSCLSSPISSLEVSPVVVSIAAVPVAALLHLLGSLLLILPAPSSQLGSLPRFNSVRRVQSSSQGHLILWSHFQTGVRGTPRTPLLKILEAQSTIPCLPPPVQCREHFHSLCLTSLKAAFLISQLGIFFHKAKLILKCYRLSKCYPKVHFSAKYTKRLGEAEEIGDCIPWENSRTHACVPVGPRQWGVGGSGSSDTAVSFPSFFCRSLLYGSKDCTFM